MIATLNEIGAFKEIKVRGGPHFDFDWLFQHESGLACHFKWNRTLNEIGAFREMEDPLLTILTIPPLRQTYAVAGSE